MRGSGPSLTATNPSNQTSKQQIVQNGGGDLNLNDVSKCENNYMFKKLQGFESESLEKGAAAVSYPTFGQKERVY